MVFKFSYENHNPGFDFTHGINMGICLILTAIASVAAILGCILLLICIKFATDRDERRVAAENSKKALRRGDVEQGCKLNTVSPAEEVNEMVALTKVENEENDL